MYVCIYVGMYVCMHACTVYVEDIAECACITYIHIHTQYAHVISPKP